MLTTINDPEEKWALLLKNEDFLNSDFEIQKQLFQEIYKNWNHEINPPCPAWIPKKKEKESTNIFKFMKNLNIKSYEEFHNWSVNNRESFWHELIKTLGINFKIPYTKILDSKSPETQPKWLCDAQFNIVDSCFNAAPDQIAIVFKSEMGSIEKINYAELRRKSYQIAACLQKIGVKKGDSIGIDMTMTIESVFIYLAIGLAGCSVVSIADSFAASEISSRLRISKAKFIFTQDLIHRAAKTLPLYAKVAEASEIPAIVVPARAQEKISVELREQDIEWSHFLALDSGAHFQPVICDAATHLNILFSSGTTGDPKAIPWTHTTPLKCASDGYFHHDIQKNDVVAWPTNLGWMMGPWLLFATFLNKGTVALFYGAPLTREFGEFVQDAKVNMLGLVPSIVKVWRSTNCMKNLDWSNIKLFSSTGECSNAEDYLFLMSLARYRPVIEYCGGTEIGGAFLTGTLMQAASPATFSTPALGLNIEILNDELKKSDKEGELYIVPPSIGLSTSLLNKDHEQVYFKNAPRNSEGVLLRKHGDQMEYLLGGYMRALGRADDTMNLGGIKVSSAEIERALVEIDGILDTAAVAINPPGGGPSLLKIFFVLKPNAKLDDESVKKQFQKAITTQLNPLFKVSIVQRMDLLPRTASNKVMRRLLR